MCEPQQHSLPRVSHVVPFLAKQFYGQDPIIEILVNQKKELQWRLKVEREQSPTVSCSSVNLALNSRAEAEQEIVDLAPL